MLLASASILGLGVILHTLPWLFTLVKWIGAAYLVYLGWRMLRARPMPCPRATSGCCAWVCGCR
jgi:threonine/homoserine/homoserine lactone efflux protein